MGSIKSVCLLFYIFISISLAEDVCYDTGNFTANSAYAKNRDLLLSSLAANVTANDGFYTTATLGQGTDKVYGLILCSGASSSEDCSRCVNSTIQSLISNCPNQKEAYSWQGAPPCLIRYANRTIFGILELSPTDAGYNTGNITSDMEQFDQIWDRLMQSLVTRASMGSSKLKFATEEADLTSFQRIYALMQCTPDLSQSNCNNCLRRLEGYYQSCCYGQQGGYVHKPNCIFRWDLYPFYQFIGDSPAPSPPSPLAVSPPSHLKDNGSINPRTVAIIIVPTIIFLALVALTCIFFHCRKPMEEDKSITSSDGEDLAENISTECLQLNFGTISLATNNFSEDNKLGEGGFGSVYKGRLPDGKVIAVKRLSRNSGQGDAEFKNEVLLVARLQHRNLVRLLGFCVEGKERLLIYEFVPNSSLDHFIFDPNKRLLVDWKTRYKIIVGIARGIFYLHEDSRLRIIHRDLKTSNILLDDEMNPKIADFGLAKLFTMDQTQDTTKKIVGTLGYMPPEYAINGRFSMKSDVFSFGVIILEIITGQKVSCFTTGDMEENLLTYAWRSWNEGKAVNLIDPNQLRVGSKREIMRCIHIGLLCVQENVVTRPTMTSVVMMLSSHSVSLPAPSKPAYFMHNTVKQEASCNLEATMLDQSKSGTIQVSVNEASISELYPR